VLASLAWPPILTLFAQREYKLAAEKRAALRLRERIDEERELRERAEEHTKSLHRQVVEASKELEVEGGFDVEKDRALRKRLKAFVPRGSLRLHFKKFRDKVRAHRHLREFKDHFFSKSRARSLHYWCHRWRAYLRDVRDLKTRAKAASLIVSRRSLASWRAAYHLQVTADAHHRRRLLRGARKAVEHWRDLARNAGKVRGVVEKINKRGEMKRWVVRWRRYVRACRLAPAEEEKMGRIADAHDLGRRWRGFVRAVKAVLEERAERVEGTVRAVALSRKRAAMREWHVRYRTAALGRTSLSRRAFSQWKVAWTVRAAGAAFWETASRFNEGRLLKKVVTRWHNCAKHERRVRREKRAMMCVLRLGESGKVYMAFEKMKGVWASWKRGRENNRKALQHYFTQVSRRFFAAWTEHVAMAKAVAKVLPVLARGSRTVKIMWGMDRWRGFVVDSRRSAKINIASNKIVKNFLGRFAGKHMSVFFEAWKGWTKKRSRSKVLAGVVGRRAGEERRVKL
jgi:hypothetical protein